MVTAAEVVVGLAVSPSHHLLAWLDALE